jgi:hypothetical protein
MDALQTNHCKIYQLVATNKKKKNTQFVLFHDQYEQNHNKETVLTTFRRPFVMTEYYDT